MTLILGLYFLTGLIRDALGTAWTLSVSRNRAFWAGSLGAFLTWFDLGIMALVVLGRHWAEGIVYGFGCGVGCAVTVLLVKNKRKR